MLTLEANRLTEVRKSIAVRLNGGIGNQLFQYAAGRAASLRNNCQLILDLTDFKSKDRQTPREFMLDVMNIEAIIELSTETYPFEDYIESSFYYDKKFNSLNSGARICGYFQSELYFAPYEARLRHDLQLVAPESSMFCEFRDKIASSYHSVSIHVRRGDYATSPSTRAFHGMCLLNYYLRAIKIIESLSPRNPTFFIFADDRTEAMRMFDGLNSVVVVETPVDRPWEDLFLMAKCTDHILANSSLSWWASWLNPNKKKTIIAPRRWFAPETMRSLNPCDLYPDGAILL